MAKDELINEQQWKKIEPLLLQPKRTSRGGRPPADTRACFEGILWVLRSGARWKDLPDRFPSASTCWRRLRDWEQQGIWEQAWVTLIHELDEQGATQLDGNLCRRDLRTREKRGLCVGPTKRGKGTKLMVVASGEGVPVGVHLASASPHEVSLIEPALDAATILGDLPTRLIADRAYDSDPLRNRLDARGIELICPHRHNRSKPPRQDGRKLRRYKRRWKIERTIAWLQNFRRIVVRWERKLLMYSAFVHVACLIITLRQF